VPFKGSAPAVNALLGNVVNLSFDTLTVLAPQIRDGKVGSPWALAIGTVAPNRCRLHERGGIRIMVLLGEADLPWL
jgi:hypothetical protein